MMTIPRPRPRSLLFLPALLPALLLAASPAALAGGTDPLSSGDYIGAHLGQNDFGRVGVHVAYASGAEYTGTADLSHGLHGGLQLGRHLDHARIELEIESGHFSLRHLTVGPINADADARGHYQAVFANGYGTANLLPTIETFVGAGFGWGHTMLPHLDLHSACTCFGESGRTGFAWQLRAGLAAEVSEQSSVVLQWTRLRLPGPETDGPPRVRYDRLGFGAWSVGWLGRF